MSGDPFAQLMADANAFIATIATDDPPPPLARSMIDGASFILDTPEQTPAVWGRDGEVLWASGESIMIVGPAGVGKTTLAGQLVRGLLGLDRAVLEWPVQSAAGKVLYLAMDRPAQAARAFKRCLGPSERDVLAERLVVWRGPPPLDLARHPEQLAAMCHEAGASHVLLDSLKDAAIGLTDEEVAAGYNRARQLALAEGVEVAELHHPRKAGAGGGAPKGLEDVYGSTWLTAGAGSVVLLWGQAGDPIVELHHLKQPAEDVGPLGVIHNPATGMSARWQATDLVTLAGLNPGLTARLAARAVFEKDAPTKNEIEKTRRRLGKLVDSGRLACRQGSAGGARGGSETTYGPPS